jgi:hypothetical protein
MNPSLLIRRPLAFVAAAPALTIPVKTSFDHVMPKLTMGAFQLRTQRMLDYLVETLRNSW